ncbi:MAG UNVERIFIED_CONTAM: DUF1501 domain-containing protein [Planctomycetaceae bacterium]|jgi:hypothetical protein
MSRHHCGRFRPLPTTRRGLLQTASCGFGALAADHLLAQEQAGPLGTHHAPTATSVIFLYMDGGVSQVDSFDPKPELDRQHGKPFPAASNQLSSTTSATPSPVPGSSKTTVSPAFPFLTCSRKLPSTSTTWP